MTERNNIHILLVEDEIIISLAQKESIECFGYNVSCAHNGEDAVRITSDDSTIDLILMDIDLGTGIDGTIAAKQILDLRDVPIVFLTSHSERSMVEKVHGITRYGYVIKNSGDFVLQSSIEMALELFDAHHRLKKQNDLNIAYQNELKTSEELFHSLYDNMTSGSGIYTVMHDGSKGSDYIIKNFNKTSLSIEDKTLGEVVGKSLADLRPAIDEYGLIPVMQKVWQTGEPAVFPVKIYEDDNFSNYYENYIFKLPSGEIVTIYNDVTEQKQVLSEYEYKNIINESLLTTTKLILEIEDFNITAKHIFDACCRLTGATAGYVALLNEDGSENEVLFLEAGNQECTVDPELPMPIRGLRAEVYKTGRAAFDNDFWNSHWMKFMPEGHVPLKNVLFAPLNIEGKTVGLIGIANKPQPFTSEDARISESFGDLAALSLRNSRKIDSLLSAQESIQLLLQEKELLLKEVHHRIKNNMNTIISLLSLQSSTLDNSTTTEALNDAKRRIITMMKLYDILYQSEELQHVYTEEYIGNLIREISKTYSLSEHITIHHDIENIKIDSKIMFSIGIIINELLSNSFKYAFAGLDTGEVHIVLQNRNSILTISIKDNGVGVPDGFKIENSAGFGLKLVNALLSQYNGKIDMDSSEGTEIIVTIPGIIT